MLDLINEDLIVPSSLEKYELVLFTTIRFERCVMKLRWLYEMGFSFISVSVL